MTGAVDLDSTGQHHPAPPGSKLTEDNIGSHMKSIESVAHHEGPVQGRGSIAPVRAKRWGPSRKGSAPTAEWVGQ